MNRRYGVYPAPTTLGDETLGSLLAGLLPHGSDLASVTDATTLANFFTALDPSLATDTVNELLGLTSTTAAVDAATALFG